MIRFLDIALSLTALLLLFPVLLVIGLMIPLDSQGPALFIQTRVGKNDRDFRLIKFRTMVKDAQRQRELTVGARDCRITRLGGWLRKFKLDEIPQLFNVLTGEMSLVGPRPEVRKYVELYTDEQRKVLSVRPGITDYASIVYFHENEILGNSTDPEKTYTEEVMPAKITLNMQFIHDPSPATYLKILFLTICRLTRH